jgi:hypothetical protein
MPETVPENGTPLPRQVFPSNGSSMMPLYFFHLTFGDRVALDEEGVELPNRSAACAEARAVVRDLSDPATGGNPRRWASWFLQVADSRGAFLRAALGHPALQLVSNDPGGPGLPLARFQEWQPTRLCPVEPAALPRPVGSGAGYRSAARPPRRSPPELVLLPGGR